MKTTYIAVCLFLLSMAACNSNDIYFQYSSIPEKGWNKDSCFVFHVPVKDITAKYNIYINIRNRGNYPYQNIWLFLRCFTPDSIKSRDSIECYLADQRGKWLGTGIGAVTEMPVIYRSNVKFAKPGMYRFDIGHGMRDSLLVGINDIGLRIEKVN